MVERAKIRCQCIECGKREMHTDLTLKLFLERKGKGVYCVECGEYGLYPMDWRKNAA